MGQFMLIAIILVCLAVAFAISALWQRSRALAIVLAIALPLAIGGLYWMKGAPAALDPANTTPPKTIDEAVAQLERLTAANPKNFGDMATLARAYMAKEQYAKARDTYARALALQPEESGLYVEYAEAMLRTSPDRQFPPEAVTLLEKALDKDPQNQRALFFLGLHQRQSGDPAAAVQTWERLLSMLDASTSTELRRQVEAARREAGMPEAPKAASIAVHVSLDPTLAREVRPGAVLYVFARTSEAAGPPVAAKRLQPDTFPVELELGDADSPMPTAKLFSQSKVQLLARLSLAGNVHAMKGDIEADPVEVVVTPGAKVELTLNRSVQ
jgi:cytochrome c-type biogenesis protein CcmH